MNATLGGSTLAQYEKGTVWAPDPGVLWGLARIYRVPLEDLVKLLAANRANPNAAPSEADLLLQSNAEQASPSLKLENMSVSLTLEDSGKADDYDERELLDKWRDSEQPGQELALIVLDYFARRRDESGESPGSRARASGARALEGRRKRRTAT